MYRYVFRKGDVKAPAIEAIPGESLQQSGGKEASSKAMPWISLFDHDGPAELYFLKADTLCIIRCLCYSYLVYLER